MKPPALVVFPLVVFPLVRGVVRKAIWYTCPVGRKGSQMKVVLPYPQLLHFVTS